MEIRVADDDVVEVLTRAAELARSSLIINTMAGEILSQHDWQPNNRQLEIAYAATVVAVGELASSIDRSLVDAALNQLIWVEAALPPATEGQSAQYYSLESLQLARDDLEAKLQLPTLLAS